MCSLHFFWSFALTRMLGCFFINWKLKTRRRGTIFSCHSTCNVPISFPISITSQHTHVLAGCELSFRIRHVDFLLPTFFNNSFPYSLKIQYLLRLGVQVHLFHTVQRRNQNGKYAIEAKFAKIAGCRGRTPRTGATMHERTTPSYQLHRGCSIFHRRISQLFTRVTWSHCPSFTGTPRHLFQVSIFNTTGYISRLLYTGQGITGKCNRVPSNCYTEAAVKEFSKWSPFRTSEYVSDDAGVVGKSCSFRPGGGGELAVLL